MWTLLAIIFFLCAYYRKRCFSVLKELNIPGPKPSLLFGNMLEIVKDPIKCHKEWIKKYGKVLGYYYGSVPIVLISDVNLIKRIQIIEFNKFINRPVEVFGMGNPKPGKKKRIEIFSDNLINLRDKRWKDIRAILTPSFTTMRMKQMAPLMNNAMDTLVKNIGEKCKTGEEFDIYEMFQKLTMDVSGRTAFGIQTGVQNNPDDPFLRTTKCLLSINLKNFLVILTLSFRSSIWWKIFRLKRLFKNSGEDPILELVELIKGVITTRRQNKEKQRPDVLQLLLDAEAVNLDSMTSKDLTANDDKENVESVKSVAEKSDIKTSKKLTDADVLDNAIVFFLAAYETTSIALAFTSHLLIHYPEVQEKIRNEVLELLSTEGNLDYNSVNKLQYLDQVIKESLRLYPPFYLFVDRECAENIDFGEFRLKKGMAVQVAVYNLHRDPDLWEDPNEFIPERFAPENKAKINPIAYQPFGAGPRNCIGMRLALMEMKLALARLLSKYSLQSCSKTEKVLSLRSNQNSMHPLNGVWMKVVPVQP